MFEDTPLDVRNYLDEIARQLASLLKIGRDEAMARIRLFWPQDFFWEEGIQNALFHELPSYWAKSIAYEEGAAWWRPEFVPKIRRYPEGYADRQTPTG